MNLLLAIYLSGVAIAIGAALSAPKGEKHEALRLAGATAVLWPVVAGIVLAVVVACTAIAIVACVCWALWATVLVLRGGRATAAKTDPARLVASAVSKGEKAVDGLEYIHVSAYPPAIKTVRRAAKSAPAE